MADRPDDGRRDYEWLYGEGTGDPDDDATRRIPVSPRPSDRGGDRRAGGGQGASGRQGFDDERTRVISSTSGRPRADQQPPRRQSTTAPPPPPPGRARPDGNRPGRPARSRRHAGRWIALAVVLILAFYLLMPLIAWTRVDKVAAEPGGQRPADTPGTTYLLVGSDSRKGLSEEQRKELTTGNVAGARTDTIMLLHVPRFGGKTLLLSLPRDSIVEIPGHSTGKINAAYAYGGPKLLVRTVEQATGLRVDDYVEIGIGGFAGMVDAVGGVQICPKHAMNDPLAGLDVKAGCQHADGPTALAYVRSRHADSTGDIARVERQREVVGKVADKAASPWTFINPVRYARLNLAAADALTVGDNVGPIALAKFAWGMRKVTGNDGLTCTVPLADLAVHWDTEKADRLFEQIRQDNTGAIECSPTGGL